jgi:hypothetical protein
MFNQSELVNSSRLAKKLMDRRTSNYLGGDKALFSAQKKARHLKIDNTVLEGMSKLNAPYVTALKEEIALRLIKQKPMATTNVPSKGRISFTEEIAFLEKLITRQDSIKKLHNAFTKKRFTKA